MLSRPARGNLCPHENYVHVPRILTKTIEHKIICGIQDIFGDLLIYVCARHPCLENMTMKICSRPQGPSPFRLSMSRGVRITVCNTWCVQYDTFWVSQFRLALLYGRRLVLRYSPSTYVYYAEMAKYRKFNIHCSYISKCRYTTVMS